MATQFQCPCGRPLVAEDAHRGLEVKCPACGRLLVVPSEAGAVAREASAAPAPVAPGAPRLSGAGRPCPHCAAPIPPWEEKCLKCGAFVEGAAAPDQQPTMKICPKCGAQIPLNAQACRACGVSLEGASTAAAQARPGLPWESRGTLGLWPAAFRTIKMVLLEPSAAFAAMKGDTNAAFLFFVIFGCGGAVVGALWSALLQTAILSNLPSPAGRQFPFPAAFGMFQGVLGVFLAPFAQALGLAIGAGLAHLGLLLTGATRRDFTTTLCVYAFVYGAAGLFQVVPLCGPIVGGIWSLVCLVIGITHAHGCEGWKGAVAVIWPVLLCCCVGGGLAIGMPALLKP